jgi:hypothetical protein
MGWIIVFALKPLLANMPAAGIRWLVAGGLCYTLGAGVYLFKRVKYHHAIWHLMVLAGRRLPLLRHPLARPAEIAPRPARRFRRLHKARLRPPAASVSARASSGFPARAERERRAASPAAIRNAAGNWPSANGLCRAQTSVVAASASAVPPATSSRFTRATRAVENRRQDGASSSPHSRTMVNGISAIHAKRTPDPRAGPVQSFRKHDEPRAQQARLERQHPAHRRARGFRKTG